MGGNTFKNIASTTAVKDVEKAHLNKSGRK
jgi:hypothetical protein